MFAAIVFVICYQCFNTHKLTGGEWWLFALALLAATALIGVTQLLIDRPTRREKRAQQKIIDTVRDEARGTNERMQYYEARRLYEQQQRYATQGNTRSQQQIVSDLQNDINRVEALMRAADEAEAEAKRRKQLGK